MSSDKNQGKMTDKAAAKVTDQAAAKVTDQAAAKVTDQAAAKVTDKAAAKVTDKAAAKSTDQAAVKSTDQAAAKSSAKETSIQLAMRVSRVSILVNLLLSAIKLVAGIIAHSGAMISDAVHSASDVLSTFVVIIGVKLSEKKSDEDHPYGHERMECVSSIVLAGLLAATGVGIGMTGVNQILSGSEGHALIIPGKMALIAAVISLLVKEWMFWYTRAAAKKINSGALMADAWHHRSDALSSIGAFIGILGARMGYPVLDSVASVVICGFILKAAFDIFKDATDKMVDHSCSEETEERIRSLVTCVPGVVKLDLLRTRLFGAKIYVDLEISADESLSLKDAHDIAQQVHDNIEKNMQEVKHCMVHVNPVSVEA